MTPWLWISIFTTIAVIYVATSLFFRSKPTLLHKKKQMEAFRRVKHISHRGGCAEGVENTIQAFRHAVEIGTDMLELDVRLTKDEVVVVSHDGSLMRLMGIDRKLSDLTYDELPREFLSRISLTFPEHRGQYLDVKNLQRSRDPPDGNADGYLEEQDFNNGKVTVKDAYIPTLEEVFIQFPDTPVNIDIKEKSQVLINKVHELIVKYNRQRTVIWGSFIDSNTTKLYQKDPTVPLFFSLKGVLKVLFCYYTGLLPFVKLKESCLEIPGFLPHFLRGANMEDNKIARGILWGVNNILMNKNLFKHLRKRGILIFSWVQNSQQDFEYYYNVKCVDGMMTDHPSRLSHFFANNVVDDERRRL